MNQIQNVGLDVHNNIRQKHGLQNLQPCSNMMADAQKHAEFLANSNRFEATTMGKYGCNIAMSVRADKAEAVKESIQRVYDSNNYFNFLNPQVAHMGVGVARNGYENRWVIVCFYDAPGMRVGGGFRGGF